MLAAGLGTVGWAVRRARTCSNAVGAGRCVNLGHPSASFVVSPDERFKLATMALFTNL